MAKQGMLLKSRAWTVKLRPNVADHLMARYTRGIWQVISVMTCRTLHRPKRIQSLPNTLMQCLELLNHRGNMLVMI